MKTKIQFLAFLLFFSLTGFNTQAAEKTMTREQAEVRVIQIKDRVNEIKAMDFSKLSTEQRASLRSELKSDKKELKDIPVVIIPLGALIVIIVLLIILL
jgi:malate/lactate dehydrogenase